MYLFDKYFSSTNYKVNEIIVFHHKYVIKVIVSLLCSVSALISSLQWNEETPFVCV